MENTEEVVIVKKKRGRKPKSETQNNITVAINETEHVPKKRGRKPKGGKLILKPTNDMIETSNIANIILHLKCSMRDIKSKDENMINTLEYNPKVPPSILSYEENNNYQQYDDKQSINNLAYVNNQQNNVKSLSQNVCSKCLSHMEITEQPCNKEEFNMKDIHQKLKDLKLQLYKNTNPDIKSACFWCTYEYDNPSCYIPKYEMDYEIYGYGSFCRPECAVAFLMKENIDDSTKFERYHLLNKIYSKIYDYKNNIRPAPDPHFLLDKFYGNLSIQEYRKLLKTQHMLLVIDKPMTRMLPELHDDNDEIILNAYGTKNSSQIGAYKVKRQSEKPKGPSKNSIIKESFGLT